MINRYDIRLTTAATVLRDWTTGQRWHFAGGYDPDAKLVSQADCALVAAWLGERRDYAGSLVEALEEAKQ